MNQDNRREDFFFLDNNSYKKRFLRDSKRRKIRRIKILSIGMVIVFAGIIAVDNFIYPFLTSEAAVSDNLVDTDWDISKEEQDSSVASALEPEPNQDQGLVNIDEENEDHNNKLFGKRFNTNKRITVMNPDNITALVNKQIFLPDGYEPKDLVVPNIKFSFSTYHEKKLMREEAARALEDLFNASDAEGLSLRAVSGYRSYDRQYSIFTSNVKRSSLERTLSTSAMPGCSEHQMGLAMDVSTKSVSYGLNNRFANTPEGKWLADNSYKFGYIIRYPEGKEDITGYSYEPWHIRYVGKELAKELYDEDLTLEEYYGFEIDPMYYAGITYDNIAEFGIDPEDLKVKRRSVAKVQETEESEETEDTEESEETEGTEEPEEITSKKEGSKESRETTSTDNSKDGSGESGNTTEETPRPTPTPTPTPTLTPTPTPTPSPTPTTPPGDEPDSNTEDESKKTKKPVESKKSNRPADIEKE